MLKTIKGITSFFRIFRREGNRDGEKLLQKGDCMRMLTDLLLAAAMLGFMGITGYCFVRKMAELLELETEVREKKRKAGCDVVIFGRSDFARECEDYLNSRGLSCFRIEEMERRRLQNVRRAGYVVALDPSDYQNLVACGILKDYCHSRCSLAVYNDGGNRNIYLENKIRILEPGALSEERVYQMVKEKKNAS